MKIIHWINPTPSNSGMYSYIHQSVMNTRRHGVESYIAYCERPESEPVVYMHYGGVGHTFSHKEAEERDCVNVIHSGMPANFDRLPHKVFETHASPEYAMQTWEAMTYASFMLKHTHLTTCRWVNQLPFWQALTNKPIFYTPPGVDLRLWSPEGPTAIFANKLVALYADSWRPGHKDPYKVLFAFKHAVRIKPDLALKLVNIPEEHRDKVHYLIGELGLGNNIEWPVEGTVDNIADYYRAADFLISPVNDEGNNVAWEAQACGCTVLAQNWMDAAFDGLIQWANVDLQKMHDDTVANAPDIRNTIKAQLAIYAEAFRL